MVHHVQREIAGDTVAVAIGCLTTRDAPMATNQFFHSIVE